MVLALGAKAPGACRRRRTRPLPGQDCHGNGGGLIAAPLFLLSRVPATTGTLNVLVLAGQNLAELLACHQSGRWGKVPPEDSKENEFSVREGYRIVSSYPVGIGRIWIITEWDRSSTAYFCQKSTSDT
jgi:hypothetical protein